MDNIIIFCAKYLIAVPIVVIFWLWWKQPKKFKHQLAAAVAMAGATALIIDKIAGKLYYDPRPFVSQHIVPLITHGADNGFPSEHTILAATLASVAYFYNRRISAGLFVVAIIIGWARVAAHVHSPIDIIGGFLIGIVSGWFGYQLAKKYFKDHTNETKT